MELQHRVVGIEAQLQSQEEKLDVVIGLLGAMTSSRVEASEVRPMFDPLVRGSHTLFQPVPHPALRRRPPPGPHVEIDDPTTTHSQS